VPDCHAHVRRKLFIRKRFPRLGVHPRPTSLHWHPARPITKANIGSRTKYGIECGVHPLNNERLSAR
jgi:hypothetical protein